MAQGHAMTKFHVIRGAADIKVAQVDSSVYPEVESYALEMSLQYSLLFMDKMQVPQCTDSKLIWDTKGHLVTTLMSRDALLTSSGAERLQRVSRQGEDKCLELQNTIMEV